MPSSNGNDLLFGGEGDDTLLGLGGNDTLSGLDGDDSLDGGTGADEVNGDGGNDTLIGGDGDDLLQDNQGSTLIDGGAGNDSVHLDNNTGGAVFQTVYGGADDDTVFSQSFGGASAFTGLFDGGTGYDSLQIYGKSIDISGVSNFEWIGTTAASDLIIVFANGNVTGGNTLTFASLGAGGGGGGGTGGFFDGRLVSDGHLVIQSSDRAPIQVAHDTMAGGALGDSLYGYVGDDLLSGGGGDDVLDGGIGTDTAGFLGIRADYLVTEDNVHGWLIVTDLVGSEGQDTLIGINRLQFADQAVDVEIPGLLMPGTPDNDTLAGGEGKDSLSGVAGNDTLSGLDGDDSLDGGTGADEVNGDGGNDTLIGGDGDDLLQDNQGSTLIDGGAGNDSVHLDNNTGGAVFQTVYGGADDDTVFSQSFGGASAFTGLFDGGTGYDSLQIYGKSIDISGVSNFEWIGTTAASDLIIVFANGNVTGGNTLTFASLGAGGGGGGGTGGFFDGRLVSDGHLVIQSSDRAPIQVAHDTMAGGALGDSLYGYVGDDLLSGGGGDDVLDGGIGTDTAGFLGIRADYLVTEDNVHGWLIVTDLVGSEGQDTLIGINRLQFADQAVDVEIPGLLMPGTPDNDTLAGGEGKDSLSGVAGNDTLSGLDGDDSLDGGTGADEVNGDGGNDTLIGGDGDDLLQDNQGSTLIDGGAGNDSVHLDNNTGGAVFQTVYGGADDDTVFSQSFGGASAFTGLFDGGTGYDSLQIYGKSIDISGVSNFEWIGTTAASDLIIVFANGNVTGGNTLTFASLGAGGGGGGGTGGFFDGRLVSDGHLVIQSSDRAPIQVAHDTMAGGALGDSLYGYVGDDLLSGGGGDDVLDGGIGTDTAGFLGNRADYLVTEDNVHGWLIVTDLVGSEGQDTLIGINRLQFADQRVNVVVPGITLTGTSGNDTLAGGEGTDSIAGGAGSDTVTGVTGNDTINGGSGSDVLDGGVGRDMLSYDGSLSGVTVNLGTGAVAGGDALGDLVAGFEDLAGSAQNDNLSGDAATNALFGGNGSDLLGGGGGVDTLLGGTGSDTLLGGKGGDSLVGGEGNDVLSYATSGSAVAVDLTAGTATGGDAKSDIFSSVEGVIGSNFNDTLTGGSAADVLSGGASNDTLEGSTGADTLLGGSGADNLSGGADIDAASYAASATGVTVNLTTGTGIGGEAQGDVLTGIENLTGSAQNDVLTGNSVDNALSGGLGVDVLSGGLGNDSLAGNSGTDTLLGGSGADSLSGGGDTDLVSYAASASGVTVNLTTGTGSGGEAQGDVLIGIENLTGSAQNDVLTGDSVDNALSGGLGVDVLSGGLGNDSLIGNSGTDTLLGGSGADSLSGGADVDLASYAASASGVTVNLTTGSGIGGDAQGDVLTGIENLTGSAQNDVLTGSSLDNGISGGLGLDALSGGSGNDSLTGNSGADTLLGGIGSDSLAGGSDTDVLTGNIGSDHFIFDVGQSGIDTITDFNGLDGGGQEGDVIELRAAMVGTFAYLGTGPFSGGSDNSEARISGSLVLVDTNGDGATDIRFTLTGLSTSGQLTDSDFVFV